MRKLFVILVIALGLVLAQLSPSSAQSPDGVIELSGGAVAVGIGYTWGSGTLIFQGKRYPLNVSGLSVASVGVTDYTAAGSVEGLHSPQDINGVFGGRHARRRGQHFRDEEPEWRGDPSDIHDSGPQPLTGRRGPEDISRPVSRASNGRRLASARQALPRFSLLGALRALRPWITECRSV